MTKKYGFSQKNLLAKADRDFDYTPLAEANGNRGKRSSDNLACTLPRCGHINAPLFATFIAHLCSRVWLRLSAF
jgi:hypothetical protein